MSYSLFDTYYPPVKVDSKSAILRLLERSGYTKIKSVKNVLYHFKKDNVDYGFIILRKTRIGFFWKTQKETHFVNYNRLDAFGRKYNNQVFVIILEESTGQTIIGCLGKLFGHHGFNKNVEGEYFPREQFIWIQSIIDDETQALACDLNKIHDFGIQMK